MQEVWGPREGLVWTSDSEKKKDKGPSDQVSGLLDRFGMKSQEQEHKGPLCGRSLEQPSCD